METPQLAAVASGHEDMPTLLAAIAALSRGQAIVVEKLTLLQFDMAGVREDMKAVETVMGDLATHVCDIRDATSELERVKELVAVDDSPPQPWNGEEQVVDIGKAPSMSTTFGNQTCDDDDLPYGHAGFDGDGNYISCKQPYMSNPDTSLNRRDSPEEERYEWGYHREISPAASSPPGQQTMVSIDKEPLEEESQQLEMSCQSTQMPTPATAPRMWADFTRAVRDWPPPTVAVTAADGGWVSTKKGRWDVTVGGKDMSATGGESEVEVLGELNLNLLPERQGALVASQGEMHAHPSMCNAGASRNGGNGSGRGRGRGRRPPAVQPRYHTMVRVASLHSFLDVCAIYVGSKPYTSLWTPSLQS